MTEPIEAPDEETPEPAEPAEPADEPTEHELEEHEHEEQQEQHEQQEPAAEPPAAEVLSVKELEALEDKLDAETARHLKRVVEIFGGDMGAFNRQQKPAEQLVTAWSELEQFELYACPLCKENMPGVVVPAAFTPERLDNVRVAIGMTPARALRADNRSQTCPDCDGWGVVDTGSKVIGQTELPCTACSARGWVGERAASQPLAPALGTTSSQTFNAASVPNGAPEAVASDPQRQRIIDEARELGLMVVDTRLPA